MSYQPFTTPAVSQGPTLQRRRSKREGDSTPQNLPQQKASAKGDEQRPARMVLDLLLDTALEFFEVGIAYPVRTRFHSGGERIRKLCDGGILRNHNGGSRRRDFAIARFHRHGPPQLLSRTERRP